ncbi:MAG: hypothetical protein U0796_05370 [Gemmatales bacterium]
MPLQVAWRLMFRVNDAAGADRCLARTREVLPSEVVEAPKPYWKVPELWEVALRSPFSSPAATGVFELLLVANRIASDWLVSGPLIANDNVSVLEGVFDAKSGRPHVAGLSWASFSVGDFPPAGGV